MFEITDYACGDKFGITESTLLEEKFDLINHVHMLQEATDLQTQRHEHLINLPPIFEDVYIGLEEEGVSEDKEADTADTDSEDYWSVTEGKSDIEDSASYLGDSESD
jgi:hypothetical protein